ncbi:hypothetical protein AND_007412 [Anopheles darlingi]|uniref:NADH dehydrogenase [ubiquinone] 1 beta subcomplex subunit 1 n=1 Tax=Anopheles darlingi TaxID=43151 RepID=W5JDI8_ANODA|nr:hypothetical protein AND_007412 [Anopheles darlingi]
MIRQFWGKYKVCIIFPALSLGAIWSDYNYTRQWKKQQLLEQQKQQQQLELHYLWGVLPLIGYGFGMFLDNKETERMTLFRDKSALYGRVLKEGEKPSWP